jgi:prepilin peptidase CpaA
LRTAILILAIGVFVAAAYGDVRARHIPNSLPLAIGALALVQLIPAGDPHPALWAITAAAMILAVGLLQWRLGLVGGGDVKLLAAATLLVGAHDLFDFLFLMSLGGAVVSLAVLGASRFGGPSLLLLPYPGRAAARPSVPYGVAIATAAAWVLIRQYSQLK